MKCTDTVTPFDDDPCPRDATDVVWIEGAPTPFSGRQAVCKEHARIFLRMAQKFFPTSEAHCEPIALPTRDNPAADNANDPTSSETPPDDARPAD